MVKMKVVAAYEPPTKKKRKRKRERKKREKRDCKCKLILRTASPL
jgi:hypothetical protein